MARVRNRSSVLMPPFSWELEAAWIDAIGLRERATALSPSAMKRLRAREVAPNSAEAVAVDYLRLATPPGVASILESAGIHPSSEASFDAAAAWDLFAGQAAPATRGSPAWTVLLPQARLAGVQTATSLAALRKLGVGTSGTLPLKWGPRPFGRLFAQLIGSAMPSWTVEEYLEAIAGAPQGNRCPFDRKTVLAWRDGKAVPRSPDDYDALADWFSVGDPRGGRTAIPLSKEDLAWMLRAHAGSHRVALAVRGQIGDEGAWWLQDWVKGVLRMTDALELVFSDPELIARGHEVATSALASEQSARWWDAMGQVADWQRQVAAVETGVPPFGCRNSDPLAALWAAHAIGGVWGPLEGALSGAVIRACDDGLLVGDVRALLNAATYDRLVHIAASVKDDERSIASVAEQGDPHAQPADLRRAFYGIGASPQDRRDRLAELRAIAVGEPQPISREQALSELLREAVRAGFSVGLSDGIDLQLLRMFTDAEARAITGMAELRSGNVEAAIENFLVGVKDQPKSAPAWTCLACGLACGRRWGDAATAFLVAHELDPSYPLPRIVSLIVGSLERRAEARSELTTIADAEGPTRALAKMALGWLAHLEGDRRAADKHVRAASQLGLRSMITKVRGES